MLSFFLLLLRDKSWNQCAHVEPIFCTFQSRLCVITSSLTIRKLMPTFLQVQKTHFHWGKHWMPQGKSSSPPHVPFDTPGNMKGLRPLKIPFSSGLRKFLSSSYKWIHHLCACSLDNTNKQRAPWVSAHGQNDGGDAILHGSSSSTDPTKLTDLQV